MPRPYDFGAGFGEVGAVLSTAEQVFADMVAQSATYDAQGNVTEAAFVVPDLQVYMENPQGDMEQYTLSGDRITGEDGMLSAELALAALSEDVEWFDPYDEHYCYVEIDVDEMYQY